jgi:hypothetical protein
LASRFHFHGEASGFSGHIRIPFQEIIPVQAAAVLSEFGGYCANHSIRFHYREIIQFDRAHTEVTGSYTGRAYCTLIQSTVEGLDINGMVTADRIVARIYSSYHNEPDGEPAIKLIGSRFENLKIAGIPVEVDLAIDIFDRLDKHHKVRGGCIDDGELRKFMGVTDPKATYTLPSNKGFTEVSLVRGLKPLAPGLRIPADHVIHIDGFGTIRLAVLQLSQYTRRLNMIHIDLGCAIEGELNVCEVQDGGIEW